MNMFVKDDDEQTRGIYPALGHNNAPVVVELSRAEAEFLREHIADTMQVSLNILSTVRSKTPSVVKLVEQTESLRGIREKLVKAL